MPESPIDAKLATEAALPLAGVRVLDLTLARAGPTCVRHLADWGAEVIRVEPPANADGFGGDRHGYDFQNLHRNKRSIALNLKSPEGKAALMKLAANADVLVENMRVKVKHRLGIAYDDLKGINPRLIYASISGFGQSSRAGRHDGAVPAGENRQGPLCAYQPAGSHGLHAGFASSALADGWRNPGPGGQ